MLGLQRDELSTLLDILDLERKVQGNHLQQTTFPKAKHHFLLLLNYSALPKNPWEVSFDTKLSGDVRLPQVAIFVLKVYG